MCVNKAVISLRKEVSGVSGLNPVLDLLHKVQCKYQGLTIYLSISWREILYAWIYKRQLYSRNICSRSNST